MNGTGVGHGEETNACCNRAGNRPLGELGVVLECILNMVGRCGLNSPV